MKGDDIADKLLRIGNLGVDVADGLPNTPTGRHLASQLLRSSTAVGSNYQEARGAESRRDFGHKLALSHKEANEALYWAKIVEQRKHARPAKLPELMSELNQAVRILGKSLGTFRKRNNPDSNSES